MRFKFEVGQEFDMLTQGELDESLKRAWEIQRAATGGIKWRRIPPMTGTPTGGNLTLGGDSGQAAGQQYGPDLGWAWALRLVTISGLARGATPDIMNMQIFGAMSGLNVNWWQFNGNNFAYTFSNVQMVLRSGEYLSFSNLGALTATGLIVVTGNAVQCPEERLSELA